MVSKKITLKIIRVTIGSIFIFSGIIKLFPIEIFEIQFVFGNGISWILTPIVSRLLISLEITLGVLLILNFWTKKIIIPFSCILLFVFTTLLTYQLIVHGNQKNCGCFGSLLPFNTYESIFKNLILFSGLYFISQKNEWISRLKGVSVIIYTLFTIILFLLYPVPNITNYNKPTKHTKSLEANFLKKINQPQLQKGEHLILFLSTTCKHCKSLTKKLSLVKEVKNVIPVHLFFLENKNTSSIETFFKETNSSFPYTVLTAHDFFPITKGKTPYILQINDNKIIKISSSKSFNVNDVIN